MVNTATKDLRSRHFDVLFRVLAHDAVSSRVALADLSNSKKVSNSCIFYNTNTHIGSFYIQQAKNHGFICSLLLASAHHR